MIYIGKERNFKMAEKNENGYSVVFTDVPECYSLDKKILECYFVVKDDFLSKKDEKSWFVGLFAVGWDTLNSCLTKVSFAEAKKSQTRKYKVEFHLDDIPESGVEDFFQFCFYSETSVVKGASSPFQIYSLKNVDPYLKENDIKMEDLLMGNSQRREKCWAEEIQDGDGGTVFVHNQASMFEKMLTKTLTEKAYVESKLSQVQEDYRTISNKLDFEKEQNSLLCSEVNSLRSDLEVAIKQNELFLKQLDEANSSINVLKDTCNASENKIICEYEEKLAAANDFQKGYGRIVKENASLQDANSKLKIKLVKAESAEKKVYAELVKCKHEKIQIGTELDNMHNQNEKFKDSVFNLEKKLQNLDLSVQDTNEEKNTAFNKIKDLEKTIQLLEIKVGDQNEIENVFAKTTEEFELSLKSIIHEKEKLSKENQDLKTRLFHIKRTFFLNDKHQIKTSQKCGNDEAIAEVMPPPECDHGELLSENADLIAALEDLKKTVININEEKSILEEKSNGLQLELNTANEMLKQSANYGFSHSKLCIAKDDSVIDTNNGTQPLQYVPGYSACGGAIPRSSKNITPNSKMAPEQKCPVCEMDFPFGFSNKQIHDHINNHF